LALSPTTKRYLSFAIKLLLTVTAFYFVFTKINFREIWEAMATIHVGYFALATLFFILSKIFSAFRINYYYQIAGVELPILYSLKLYWLGMFYNLFLPGSIGGDGYKVYLLKQQYTSSTRHLLSATLLDRGNGMAILVFLAAIFLYFSSFVEAFWWVKYAAIAGAILVIPAFYLVTRLFFSLFVPCTLKALHWSFWVQLSQAICAIFLLVSLNVFDHYWEYLTLFMVSSAASVLPISVGGAGIREIVFLYGVQYLEISQPTALAFSLLFFAITAFVSLIGVIFSAEVGNVPVEKQVARE
jgi:glycosyltransferase 2 family protein